MRRYKGFTLIELLVVIAIIGILAALSLFGLQGSFENSRDTQRKSDLKQFQASLESYANKKNGLYPLRSTSAASTDTLCTDLGLTGCPQDPKYNAADASTPFYKYQTPPPGGLAFEGTAAATNYVLWMDPESSTNYWVVCSNGKSGENPSAPSGGVCPLP